MKLLIIFVINFKIRVLTVVNGAGSAEDAPLHTTVLSY